MLMAFFSILLTSTAFTQETASPVPRPIDETPIMLKYSMDSIIPEAKQSYYSTRIPRLLKEWPPCGMPDSIENLPFPVWMQPIRTPSRPNYIGLRKKVYIHASVKNVQDLIDGFQNYKTIFSDLNETRVISVDGNKIVTYWERPSPVFFISNTRYEQIYLVDKTIPSRIAYRYQLKSGNHVNFSDGLIVLEQKNKDTLLTAYDFFEADWGLLRTLAESSIWKNSLEGSLRGDFEFQARAEHPDWDQGRIKAHADKLIHNFPINMKQLVFLEDLDKNNCQTSSK